MPCTYTSSCVSFHVKDLQQSDHVWLFFCAFLVAVAFTYERFPPVAKHTYLENHITRSLENASEKRLTIIKRTRDAKGSHGNMEMESSSDEALGSRLVCNSRHFIGKTNQFLHTQLRSHHALQDFVAFLLLFRSCMPDQKKCSSNICMEQQDMKSNEKKDAGVYDEKGVF